MATDSTTNITADDVQVAALELLERSEYLKDQFVPIPAAGAASKRFGRFSDGQVSEEAFGNVVSADSDIEDSMTVSVSDQLRKVVRADLAKQAQGFRGAYGEQLAIHLAKSLSAQEDRVILRKLGWEIATGSAQTVNPGAASLTPSMALEARDILLENSQNSVADLLYVMSPSAISKLQNSDHGNFRFEQIADQEMVGMRSIGTYYGVPVYESNLVDGTRKNEKSWVSDSASGSADGSELTVTLSSSVPGIVEGMPFLLSGHAGDRNIASALTASSVAENGGVTEVVFTSPASTWTSGVDATDGLLVLDAQVNMCINRELVARVVEFERQAQIYPDPERAATVWSLHSMFGFSGFDDSAVRLLSPRI